MSSIPYRTTSAVIASVAVSGFILGTSSHGTLLEWTHAAMACCFICVGVGMWLAAMEANLPWFPGALAIMAGIVGGFTPASPSTLLDVAIFATWPLMGMLSFVLYSRNRRRAIMDGTFGKKAAPVPNVARGK